LRDALEAGDEHFPVLRGRKLPDGNMSGLSFCRGLQGVTGGRRIEPNLTD
jgi:hypothetical protein